MENQLINGLYELNPNIYNKNKLTIISGGFCSYKTMLSLQLYNELVKSNKNVLFVSPFRTNLIAKKIAKLILKNEVIDSQKVKEKFKNSTGRLLKIGDITKDELIEKLNKESKVDYDLIIIDFDCLSMSYEFNNDDLMDINNSIKAPILFVQYNATYDDSKNMDLITLNVLLTNPHFKRYLQVHHNNDLIAILDIGENGLNPTFITEDINNFITEDK